MVKSLKYYLSVFFITFIFSCKENKADTKKPSSRQLAEVKFKSGEQMLQGSPESMRRIEEAIAIDSTYAEALRELSVAYLKRGMPHKWKAQYEKAIQHDPQTWVPWRGYLFLWFYRDYKKAIADFNASDTLTTHIDYPQGHSVDFWRGIAYLGLKDYKNSIAYWDKYIKKETEDTGEDWVELEAFLYRGIAYYESGDASKALEDFNKAIKYFKKTADAKYYKAKIHLENNKPDKALQLLNEATEDFKAGFYNNRPYVETLRQIYLSDLEAFKSEIMR